MPNPQPRPGNSNELLWLPRRPKSGFVNYPRFFQRRMADGRARFMTNCDMLIGPCACGYTHDESTDWVQDLLQSYNCKVEPLILWSVELIGRGLVVEIPGYWKQCRRWNSRRTNCDVLVGKCSCGTVHTPRATWVKNLLNMHGAVILNMPPVAPPSRPARPTRVEPMYSFTPSGRGTPGPARIPPASDNPRERHHPPVDLGRELNLTDLMVHDPYLGELRLPAEAYTDLRPVETGCDCVACERQTTTNTGLLRERADRWVSRSVDAWSSDPVANFLWAVGNCNADGAVPGWCNCPSCCSARLNSLGRRDAPNLTNRADATLTWAIE